MFANDLFCIQHSRSLRASSTNPLSHRFVMNCMSIVAQYRYDRSRLKLSSTAARDKSRTFQAPTSGILLSNETDSRHSSKALISTRFRWRPRISVCSPGRHASTKNTRIVSFLTRFRPHSKDISPGCQGKEQPNGGASSKNDKGSTSSSSRNRVSTGLHNFSTSHSRSRKRRKQDDDPHTPRPVPGPPTEDTGGMRLACPFYLHDRRMYPLCGTHRFRNFSDVRQHLTRAHKQTVHCARCGTAFDGDYRGEEWIQHQRSQLCSEVSFEPFPGITQDQFFAISNITAHGSQDHKWSALWRILFPTEAPPLSPWLPQFADTSEVYLQYMIDLRDNLISGGQSQVFQTQWNTPLMVSASNDQRHAIVSEVTAWFIQQGRTRISLESGASPRANRSGSSATTPAPISGPPQPAHNGPLSLSGFGVTTVPSPMISMHQHDVTHTSPYEHHTLMGNNLNLLLQDSSHLSWSRASFTEPTPATSSIYMQSFPLPPQEEPVYLSEHRSGVINNSFPTTGRGVVAGNASYIDEPVRFDVGNSEETWNF